MSVTDDVPELDGADLLGVLFQDGNTEDPFFSDGNALMEDWFSEQDMLNGVDTEDFLSSLLGEDDCVPYLSHSPLGSDSGISDDSHNNPCQSDTDPAPSPEAADSATSPASLPDTQAEVMEAVAEAVQTDHCYSRQQEGDILESVRSEKPDTDVFIDLDDWDSTEVMQDQSNEVPCTLAMEEPSQCNKANQFQFQFQEIILTDEERRLLAKEGVSIPSHLPLTKAEERTLKRVRRKIRNKQSAQESRKKKKVYVDGLENRVAVCTAHNQELQKKVQMLQKENMSLIEQLRKLQALMKLTTMKTTTTSTCVMVFLLSFCLIIFPSVNPFGSSRSQKDVYTPSGVLSRTLRSIPENVERLSSMEVVDEDELLLVAKVENSKAMLSSGQNHTPDYQRVERPESESGVNSNSSSDFPNPANTELNSIAAGPEGRRDPSVPPVDYQVTGTKENWIDRKPTSVIIQQHRSDEM